MVNWHIANTRTCVSCGAVFCGPLTSKPNEAYCLRPCRPEEGKMNAVEQYKLDRDLQVYRNIRNSKLQNAAAQFTPHLVQSNYVKGFTWMGVPIIQYPSDLMVIQELIHQLDADLVIETGIAFGGGLLVYASAMDMKGSGHVLGIDIDPREDNVRRFEESIVGDYISHIKGSSTDAKTIRGVHEFIARYQVKRPLIILDSHHTHEHVLQELRLYAPLVPVGSYLIVMDSAIEFYHNVDITHQDRPWGKGNNPHTAIMDFLNTTDSFEIDKEVEQRALITSAPDGFLRRIS